jgi:TetR/AcrR family transcriptional repressor of nem operon
MDLFWKQGFEATSIQELVEATGINRGSMYDTFGDKRDLFIAALTHYADQSAENRLQILKDADAPLDGIRNFFHAIIEASGTEETQRLGCLMTNSTVELSLRDPEIGDLLRDRLEQVESAFARSLRKAKRRGELHRAHKTRALARFLTGTIQGIRVLARAGADRATLVDIVDVALSQLDGAPVPKKKAVIDRGAR